MRIEVEERKPKTYVVMLDGDVDMSSSPEVRKVLVPIFQRDANQVVVDLSGVSYMDSSGIATLIEGFQRSQKRGIRFTLAGMRPSVEAAFDLAHLKDIFEVVSGVDTALQ